MTGRFGALRYLEADAVQVSEQAAGRFAVRTADDRVLGFVEAVLIEPRSRRARYYVVATPGVFSSRRHLVPTDRLATVDTAAGIIYIDVNRSDLIEQFDISAIPRFSDEDLIETLFASAA